jgi:hypothetical protein
VLVVNPTFCSRNCSKCETPSQSILTLRAANSENDEESQSFVQCDTPPVTKTIFSRRLGYRAAFAIIADTTIPLLLCAKVEVLAAVSALF